MPIQGKGWEILITRLRQEKRAGYAHARTVSTYAVHHDGAPVHGLQGVLVERQGPGDNSYSGVRGHRRIEAGRYALSTHDGASNENYKTFGYAASQSRQALPRPAIRLRGTGSRQGILIHPGSGYIWSVGCFNLGTALGGPGDDLDFVDSRGRVIALIEDMRAFLGHRFPTTNNQSIPDAHASIIGEP